MEAELLQIVIDRMTMAVAIGNRQSQVGHATTIIKLKKVTWLVKLSHAMTLRS